MPQADSIVFTEPIAVRLLGDPAKRWIVSAFMGEPKTALQAARETGIKPPTMYHHVSKLVAAGLLVVVEERPKRGTVEKLLQTPARQMTAAASVGKLDETLLFLRQTFDAAYAEVEEVVRRRPGGPVPVGLAHVTAKVGAGGIDEIVRRIKVASEACTDDDPGAEEMEMLLVIRPKLQSDQPKKP